MDTKALPDILTLRQTCEVLNVHPNTLRQWDAKGILVAIRFGARRDRRFRKEDVLGILDSGKITKYVPKV